jgi:hypothetical protein
LMTKSGTCCKCCAVVELGSSKRDHLLRCGESAIGLRMRFFQPHCFGTLRRTS